ncbi:MAG: hypothetical protein IPM92_02150 [Saprospiraceae bacterium]|nr:hypothetical protein [Saprospiraceae bacterium]
MNSKIIIAGLLGGICSFLISSALYGMLLQETFASMCGSATGTMRSDDEIIFWALILGNLVIGYMVAYIFSTWANISTFMGGLIGGITMGVLFTAGYDFIFYGTTHVMSLNGILLDIVVNIIIWGVSSGVVGWWLGRSK